MPCPRLQSGKPNLDHNNVASHRKRTNRPTTESNVATASHQHWTWLSCNQRTATLHMSNAIPRLQFVANCHCIFLNCFHLSLDRAVAVRSRVTDRSCVPHHVFPLKACPQVGVYEFGNQPNVQQRMVFGGEVVQRNTRVIMFNHCRDAIAIIEAMVPESAANGWRKNVLALVIVENLVNACRRQ